MSDAVAHLSPAQALRMVAAAPGGKAKTAASLRHEAQLFGQDAERRDRLAVSSLTSNRRAISEVAAARHRDRTELDDLRSHLDDSREA